MNEKFQITATIVLYEENIQILKKTIDSFLETPLVKKLYLVDNSPTDALKTHFNHPDIVYFFNGKNLGFGKGHNVILDNIKKASECHLILNPDVVFSPKVIPSLIEQLKKESNLSMIAPKVVYPNGNLQYTCRKHPSFFDLMIRKIGLFKERIYRHEYRDKDLNKSFPPDFIHGCFMLFKTQDFLNLEGFDKRYFLYMEDADICRKIDATGKKKMYYPYVEIVHVLKKGSNKDFRLFFRHVVSALKYFNKWGY